MVGGAEDEAVPPDTELTQLGQVACRNNGLWARANFSFRCGLRQDDGSGAEETYVSLLEGRLSVEEAVPLIARGDIAGGADAVRYVLAETLLKREFRVVFKPLAIIEGHIGVYWDHGEWDNEVATRFDACFTECTRGPQSE